MSTPESRPSSTPSARPVLFGSCIYDGQRLRVHSATGHVIEISDPPSGLISLLTACTGERTIADLLTDVVPTEHHDVALALDVLYDKGALVSGSSIFRLLHQMTANPSMWHDEPPSDGDVRDIMAVRRYADEAGGSISHEATIPTGRGSLAGLITRRRSATYDELCEPGSPAHTRCTAIDLVSSAYRNVPAATK
jgi:hypothetical protein